MIGSLRGQVILRTDKFLVLEAGGVGYKVYATPDALSKSKSSDKEVLFWTHTHVREDSIDLYGFLDREELAFFEMLIGVSGIGPKSAVALLGITNVDTLKKAIGTGDTSYLTKVSGIGKKTAERIVIELKDKLEDFEGPGLQGEVDALEALKSLGYSQHDAREALKKVSGGGDINSKLREALKILGQK